MGLGSKNQLRGQPWRISLIYVLVGTAWILGSDRLVEVLLPEEAWSVAQAYKGVGFVVITALVLLWTLRLFRAKVDDVHRELEASSERYVRFFEQSLAGVFELDGEGRLVAENPAFRVVLGLGPGANSGPFGDFVVEQEVWRQVWQEMIGGENLGSRVMELRAGEGVVRRCEVRLNGIRERGMLVGVRGFLVDHTALLELQEAMTQRQRLEAVGRLAGGVAHDFNNILTAIMGYSEWLEAGLPADSQANEAVQGLKKAAEKAGAITRQLMIFSAKDRGEVEVLDIGRAMQGMTGVLQRLLGEKVRLEAMTSEEPLCVLMDPAQFDQILLNLVVNARDAMPGGGVVALGVESAKLSDGLGHELGVASGDYVLLSVRDTGVGMSPEVLSHAFEPFFTTKRTGGGIGIGLSTVFGLTKSAGGHVSAESTVGKGTVFSVYLPRVEKGCDEEDKKLSFKQEVPSSLGVLLVEDHEEVREMMVHVLSSQGFEVFEDKDGRGVDALSSGQGIGLAIIDLGLPLESGSVVANRVKARWPGVQILFISGHRRGSDALSGLLQPSDRLLEKPFVPSALVEAVHEILGSGGLLG